MQKALFVFLMLLFSQICLAQDIPDAKQTVNAFLHNWLVEKNFALVESYFARDIFTNKYLLSEGGIFFEKIKEKDRSNPQKAKQKTLRALREFTSHIQGNSIREILIFEDVKYDESSLLSSPKEDLYVLYRMDDFDEGSDALTSDKENIFKYIKSKFPSKDYLYMKVLVKYKDTKTEAFELPVYAIWARDNSSWKIVQLGLEPQ